jgi:hypothetical protein
MQYFWITYFLGVLLLGVFLDYLFYGSIPIRWLVVLSLPFYSGIRDAMYDGADSGFTDSLPDSDFHRLLKLILRIKEPLEKLCEKPPQWLVDFCGIADEFGGIDKLTGDIPKERRVRAKLAFTKWLLWSSVDPHYLEVVLKDGRVLPYADAIILVRKMLPPEEICSLAS